MKDLRISSLFDDIVEGCRDTAATLDSLKSGDGAIRLCYLPQNEFGADQMPWNTCYGDRYEVVARLTEGGNFVINRDGRDGEPVDTYAFSALKVAACLMAYERNSETRHSGDKLGEGYDEEHGFGPYKGAILYQLSYNYKVFALLVVVVSGGKQEEDEMAALAATDAIEKWCKKINAEHSAPVTVD